MSNHSAQDVLGLIDRQKLGWTQISTIILCFCVMLLDGFDTQSIGYAAPAIIKDWHIDKVLLGPVFSAGLFGLMIGAFVFGTLADHLGRKRTITLCVLIFGCFTLAIIWATNLDQLLVLRFLAGVGLGGAMPNAIALISENMPKHIRATAVTIMVTGFSIGAALGGLLAAKMLAAYGWVAVFYVGGLVPLALVPVLILWLPESVRLLVLMDHPAAKVAALLRKMVPSAVIPAGTTFTVAESKVRGFTVWHLFREGRALPTALLWTAFFMNLIGLYFLSNWLPTVINAVGIPVEKAILVTSMFQVGGTVGAITIGRLIDNFGAYRVLTLAFTGASLCIFLIGSQVSSLALLTTAVFCAGFFVVGGQIGANALAGVFYPTAFRSTGVGYALGVGRIGSVIGPLLGGLLLAMALPHATLFAIAAIPAMCAAVAIFAMGRATLRIGSATPAYARP